MDLAGEALNFHKPGILIQLNQTVNVVDFN